MRERSGDPKYETQLDKGDWTATVRDMARLVGRWEAYVAPKSFDDLCAIYLASATELFVRSGIERERAGELGKIQLIALVAIKTEELGKNS